MIEYIATKFGLTLLMLLITTNGLAGVLRFFTNMKNAWLIGFAVACGISFITYQVWFILKYIIGG